MYIYYQYNYNEYINITSIAVNKVNKIFYASKWT